jgi:hypothetical protein
LQLRWDDFENERGGGVKDLIRVYKDIDGHDEAITYTEECQQNFQNGGRPSSRKTKGNGSYQREVEATYPYHDAAGLLAFEVVRSVYKLPGESYVLDARGKRTKDFRQRRPSGESDGSWLWGLDAGEYMRPAPGSNWAHFNTAKFEQYPDTRQRKIFDSAAPIVLYRLPELIKAVATGRTICIAEGEKKADLIQQTFGFPATCCAGGAKKWLPEYSAFLKGADAVLLPDNDPAGRDHVEAIAESLTSIARRIRILELPNLPEKGDVVDWHVTLGGTAKEFARLVDAAQDYVPDETAGPQPLTRTIPDPDPFPLEALGPELASVAQAICDIVQCPIEMCAASVLASASFAASMYVDILLPIGAGDIKPILVWILISALSGERKDTVDGLAFGPQQQHERDLKTARIAAMAAHQVKSKMWKAQAKLIEKDFQKAPSSEAHQKALEQLGLEPEVPLEAIFMSSNFTYEGLFNSLNIGQPMYGIIGTEGGQFIGGHGMADNRKLDTIAGLNDFWDGKSAKKVRAQEILAVFGRRVGMSLMVQPAVTEIALADVLFSRLGFFGRVLICEPKSLIGSRLHKDPPPEAAQSIQRYKDRMHEILKTPYPLVPNTRNELQPRVVPLSAEAKTWFWEFYNEVETETAPGKEYSTIAPLANKLAQHAVRIGATIAAYQNLNFTELGADDLKRGMQIAVYFASEAKRLFGANAGITESVQKLPPPQKISLAQTLLDWLAEWKKPIVSARDIYTYGPNSIRDKDSAIALAEVLAEHGHLTPSKRDGETAKIG